MGKIEDKSDIERLRMRGEVHAQVVKAMNEWGGGFCGERHREGMFGGRLAIYFVWPKRGDANARVAEVYRLGLALLDKVSGLETGVGEFEFKETFGSNDWEAATYIRISPNERMARESSRNYP